tara:strand:- start:3172 stop:3753 length:582 start_codon:yes stop_codon:yes gene_type:complete
VKSITTGEGGIITTNSKKIFEKIKLYKNHGIKKNKNSYWKYDVILNGFNYRISDINCALGISQLKKLDIFILKRKECFNLYFKELNNLNENISIYNYSRDINPSYHLMLLNINFKIIKDSKDNFIKYLNKNSIFPQFHYIPISEFSISNENKKLNGAIEYFKNTISIPIFPGLKKKDQIFIINTIKKYFKKII